MERLPSPAQTGCSQPTTSSASPSGGQGVQLPQPTAAESADQGQDVKDTTFPREPSCVHLACSVAKQQVITGGKCNHLPADGQCIGPPLKTDGQLCQICLLWHCGFWCKAALPGEGVQQQQRSQISPGHEIWSTQWYSHFQSLLGSLMSSQVGWSYPTTMSRPFSLPQGGRSMMLLGYYSLGELGWWGLTAC